MSARPPNTEPAHGCVFCGYLALYRAGSTRMGWIYTCRDHVKAAQRAVTAEIAKLDHDKTLFLDSERKRARLLAKHGNHTTNMRTHRAPAGYQMRHR